MNFYMFSIHNSSSQRSLVWIGIKTIVAEMGLKPMRMGLPGFEPGSPTPEAGRIPGYPTAPLIR